MLEGVLVIDRRGDIRACSESLARLAGRSPTELAGEPVWSLLPGWSPFGDAAIQSRLRVLGGRASFAVDLSRQALHLPGETLFMIEVRGRDSSAAQASAALADAAEMSPDAVMITDRSGVIQYVNAAFETMSGFAAVELAGRTPAVLKSGAQDAGFYRKLWNTILGGREYRGILVNRRKSGELYYEEKIIRRLANAGGRTTHFISSGRDISERVREIETLRHAATHDGLTGLPNRGLFLDRLEQSLRRASRREEAFALAVADIDRFKGINDRFGHSAGDAVLQAVAGRLSQCVREADTVSRLGGDEFGVILAGAGTRDAAAAVLGKVVASGSLPIRLDGGRIAATLSVGAVLFPGDGVDGEELRAHADSAMYRAKRAGGGALRFYRQALASLPRRLRPDA